MLKIFRKFIDNGVQLLDIQKDNKLWFRCMNNYSTFYKTPLQLMQDISLVERADSNDACLIGVICGEAYRDLLKTQKSQNFHNFILREEEKNFLYKICGVHRDGIIEYKDSDKVSYYVKTLSLAQNKEMIKQFTANNAYYIGFLAGLELHQIKHNLKPSTPAKSEVSHLKLVYSKDN